MNRYLALLLAAFILGGAIGAGSTRWLYALKMKEAILAAEEAQKEAEKLIIENSGLIAKVMRENQACVKQLKPECVEQ